MIPMEAGTAIPGPSNALVRQFEEGYGVKLPTEYLAVLRLGNGGVPIAKYFDHGRNTRVIERMLCLTGDPEAYPVHGEYDIDVVITQLDERLVDDPDLMGMTIIPIAELFAGDHLCFDFRGNASDPTVAVWDHERSRALAPHVELVASSFGAFERMLYATGGERRG